MYKKIIVFICCVVLVSKTVNSQIVSVEGVWHADTVQYAAPSTLTICEFTVLETKTTQHMKTIIFLYITFYQ